MSKNKEEKKKIKKLKVRYNDLYRFIEVSEENAKSFGIIQGSGIRIVADKINEIIERLNDQT